MSGPGVNRRWFYRPAFDDDLLRTEQHALTQRPLNMNENIPSKDPVEPQSARPLPPQTKLHPVLGGGLGLLLFVVSCALCYISFIFLLFGFFAASVSLVYKGYRSIFIGYILTIGIALLGAIIYCANQPFDMK
jgi:hypothetical protein